MPEGIGKQILLGIQLTMDSKGVVTGAALAENALNEVGQKAQNTQNQVTSSSRQMGSDLQTAMGLGAAGAAALGAGVALQSKVIDPMVDQAKTFEAEMAQLTFVTGAHGKELEQLRDKAIETGLVTQFSPQEAARAMRLLRAAGLDTQTMLESLNATLKIVTGSGGQMDLETGAMATAAALLKFSRTGETATDIMNSFAQVTRETNMQMRDLPIFLNSMRDAASTLKMTAPEAFTVVGILRSMGMRAAQAGLSLAGFSRQLAMNQRSVERYLRKNKISEEELFKITDDKMPDKVRAFKDLGIQIFDTSGKMKDMTTLLTDMADRALSLSAENQKKFFVTAQTLFGAQSKSIISSIMHFEKYGKTGSAAFREVIKQVKGSKTALDESAASVEDTMIGLEKFIQGTKETIQVVAGETLMPYMQKFNLVTRDLLNRVLEFAKENPKLVTAVMVTATALAVVAKVIGLVLVGMGAMLAFKVMLAPMFAAMAAQGGFLAFTMGALQAALWPIVLALGAVAAAIGIAILAVKAWEKIWDETTGGIWGILRNFFTDVKLIVQGFIEFWNGQSDNVTLFKDLRDRGLLPFVITLLQWRDRLFAYYKGLWEGFKAFFMPIVGVAKTVVYELGSVFLWLQKIFRGFEAHDVTKDIKDWQAFGKVVGWIAGVVLTLLIAKLAIALAITLFWPIVIAAAVAAVIWLGIKVYELALIIGDALAEAWEGMQLMGSDIANWVSDVANSWFEMVRSIGQAISEAWGTVRQSFDDAMQWVEDLITSWFEFGKSIGSRLVEGIKEGFEGVWNSTKEWFTEKVQWLRDMLPGSDARIGPLSTLTDSGRAMMTTLATGVDQGAPAFQSAVGRGVGMGPGGVEGTVTPAIPAMAPADVAGGINKNVSITIDRMEFNVERATPAEAERLALMIMDRLREHMDDEQEVSFA